MGPWLKVDLVFVDFGSTFGKYEAENKLIQWCYHCNLAFTRTNGDFITWLAC